MTETGAQTLVKDFLKVLEKIRIKHYKSLPLSVQDSLKSTKDRLKSAKSIREKTEISQEFRYLQNVATLKVIGFNSGMYDLPCLMNQILGLVDLKKVHVIKRGETIFSLSFDGLSFRDCMNYSGPMSLSKFAAIFELPISKGIFPYEKFRSISEMEKTKTWPSYRDFWSSLPNFETNFVSEINEILSLPILYSIENFGEFLDFFQIDVEFTPQA